VSVAGNPGVAVERELAVELAVEIGLNGQKSSLSPGSLAAPRFSGPLDLLLEIVRRNGYPLDQLPLAEITRQFLVYLQQSHAQNLDLGSDFFDTASWLVLLKSRALLPQSSHSREVRPEEELRRALLDHERIEQWSGLLGERLEQTGLGSGSRIASGSAAEEGDDADAVTRQPPTVQDLLASARRALAAAHSYPEPDTAMTIDEALSTLTARLAALTPECASPTEDWLGIMQPAATRCALLLALLELARLGQVCVFQTGPFARVWIKRPAPPSVD
jgi:segregation and condensation protein A